MHEITAVKADESLAAVVVLLAQYPDTPSVVVVSPEQLPIGLVSRRVCLESDLTLLVGQVMDKTLLSVELGTSMSDILQRLGRASHEQLAQGFVMTQAGRYLGIVALQDLLVQLSKTAQTELKLLADNPVYLRLQQLLLQPITGGAVARIDLEHFGPYNHVFGYHKGDELIRFTWDLIQQVCQPEIDQASHLGGDNFLLLLQSPDWQARCHQLVLSFAQQAMSLMGGQRYYVGGFSSTDRHGKTIYHPFPTITVGVIPLAESRFESACEVLAAASQARQCARDKTGNALFIEPRRLRPVSLLS